MGRVRDYATIVHRLRDLPRREWRVESVGNISGYPFFRVTRFIRGAPAVLLTAGIHGEEPGSVEGALRWLEGREWKRYRLSWFVLPCINPYGWERNQRRNAERLDINRQFCKPHGCREAELIKRLVRGHRFLFSFDLHEDVDAPGYYLYELAHRPPFVGEKIIQAVRKVIPINRDKVIDGHETTGLALIRRDSASLTQRRRWPMAYHLFLHCTDHILGSETPVRFPLYQRARAHSMSLRAALKMLVQKR